MTFCLSTQQEVIYFAKLFVPKWFFHPVNIWMCYPAMHFNWLCVSLSNLYNQEQSSAIHENQFRSTSPIKLVVQLYTRLLSYNVKDLFRANFIQNFPSNFIYTLCQNKFRQKIIIFILKFLFPLKFLWHPQVLKNIQYTSLLDLRGFLARCWVWSVSGKYDKYANPSNIIWYSEEETINVFIRLIFGWLLVYNTT